MTNKIKPYKKESEASYAAGAYAVIELLHARPEAVQCVYIHSAYRDTENLEALCAARRVPCIASDRAFAMVNQKENSYVLGLFHKYHLPLDGGAPHVVLVHPADMGNLGTLIRTMAGLNLRNLAIIEPGADLWHPKTVRASMGALFRLRHQSFASFEDYRRSYPDHCLFPFMLNGALAPEEVPACPLFSLVFGNEASGLDASFSRLGRSVKIPLSPAVDSYNLAVAAGIGAYVFARKNMLI